MTFNLDGVPQAVTEQLLQAIWNHSIEQDKRIATLQSHSDRFCRTEDFDRILKRLQVEAKRNAKLSVQLTRKRRKGEKT